MNLDRIIAVRNNKTVYRDGGKILKVFDRSYAKSDVLNEALNQALAEETGLPVPKILDVTVVDGKWAIVSEFVKGESLASLMEKRPDRKDEYLELFVDLQMKIHGKTCPGLPRLKDKLDRKICQTDLRATVRYDLHARLDSMPKHSKLCHGDFNPSNIILTDDGVPYILDWSHATQGNASADAARTYLLFWMNGDADTARQYLNLFCEKSHTAAPYVQKWVPIVAAAQTVKGNEREREFLLSRLDAADFDKGGEAL